MVFQCFDIRQVPWEVLKTVAFGLGFQHLPRDLANVNAWKTMFDPYIDTPCDFSTILTKEATFMTSSLLPITACPFWKESTVKGKNLLPFTAVKGGKFFPLRAVPFSEGKPIPRVASL